MHIYCPYDIYVFFSVYPLREIDSGCFHFLLIYIPYGNDLLEAKHTCFQVLIRMISYLIIYYILFKKKIKSINYKSHKKGTKEVTTQHLSI